MLYVLHISVAHTLILRLVNGKMETEITFYLDTFMLEKQILITRVTMWDCYGKGHKR